MCLREMPGNEARGMPGNEAKGMPGNEARGMPGNEAGVVPSVKGAGLRELRNYNGSCWVDTLNHIVYMHTSTQVVTHDAIMTSLASHIN